MISPQSGWTLLGQKFDKVHKMDGPYKVKLLDKSTKWTDPTRVKILIKSTKWTDPTKVNY